MYIVYDCEFFAISSPLELLKTFPHFCFWLSAIQGFSFEAAWYPVKSAYPYRKTNNLFSMCIIGKIIVKIKISSLTLENIVLIICWIFPLSWANEGRSRKLEFQQETITVLYLN